MIINNNLASLVAYNSLSSTNKSLQKSLQTLSTGLRINSSSDDAAGFAISNKMRSQIGGLDTAIRNSRDGISLLQTAEGALEETNSMLQRMRDLAIQASNDTLTSQDRSYIQAEIDELKGNIDRIANNTQFNNKRLLDGSSGALWSSSDAGLKAHINGGLTSIDSFGQKVSSEGNYRIEVKADPGQAQVQKSNVYNLSDVVVKTRLETVEETVTETVTEEIAEISTEIIYEDQTLPHSIYINEGVDTLNATSGNGWNFQDGVLTITGNGTYNIVGTGEATTNRIVVSPNVNATVFLDNVNIKLDDTSSTISARQSAFYMARANVDLYLKGVNSLRGGRGGAGIYVPQALSSFPARLTISSASGDGSTDGTLIAEGIGNTGIGGGVDSVNSPLSSDSGQKSNSISIRGGTIIATSYVDTYADPSRQSSHNGIGSGIRGSIAITGGDVTAISMGTTNYNGASGIGGYRGADITISGGTVKAYGGSSATGRAGAGIGGFGGGIVYTSLGMGRIMIKNGLDITAVPGSENPSLGNPVQEIGNGGGGANWIVQYSDTLRPPTPRDIPEQAMINVKAPKEVIKETKREVTREVTRIVGFTTKEVKTEETSYKKLSEIKEFYNPSGTLTVDPHQTITITQGDGRTANITLYPDDTMYDVAEKINNAIANDLGQAMCTDNHSKFCTIADGTKNTSESVFSKEPVYDSEIWLRDENGSYVLDDEGNRITLPPEARFKGYDTYATMLVRSAIPGKAGELYFSGDEDLLHALGLNTIQESSESTFTASVYDAHSGRPVSTSVKATGPEFKSIIPPEIDIELDPMTDIRASWDKNTKRYIMSGNGTYSSALHLKDNGTILQVGANSGEDMLLSFGDMSCSNLGIKQVIVTTSDTAKRAIGIIDRAINRVSKQRAKIGAYENALERNVDNLTTESANLTLTDSRIRDADMSKAMMNFVKFQTLNQAGTSMLAQANQLPQSVLSLLQ